MTVSPTQDVVRFGLFELDLKAGELSKNGTKIRLPQQPLHLLGALLERPGQILTRDELRQRLWPSDVFVDFDHGLNKSIQKLRDALGDLADSPRYIETIPRVGYRFIAPVNHGVQTSGHEASEYIPQVSPDRRASQPVVVVATKKRRWSLVAACIVLLVITAGWLIHKKLYAVQPIRSLAVLPLDNLSGDPAQNYLADGMTDELTTMLAKNSTLRITSRTSVMQYKGVHRPLPQIAQALGVDGIIEGSVERSGDKIHMTLQLIRAPTDTHVWADSYDRNVNDLVSLPEEAAQTVARQLHSSVFELKSARYINPEAHDAYLRGRYLWFGGKNEEAGQYFKKAIELQPDYALGWVGLSRYYGGGAVDNLLNPVEALPKAEEAAAKAVELDDSIPEAHETLGAAFFFNRWDWAQADHEIDRAIELNPQLADVYTIRAKLLTVLNRNEDAIEAEKKAQELDPFERPFAMAMIYFIARRYDEAIDDAQLKLVTLPNNISIHWALCESFRRKGDLKDAAQEWSKILELSGDREGAATVHRVYEKDGYRALLLWQVGNLKRESASKYVSPVDLALQYAQLGDRDETLAMLEEGYRLHVPDLLWVQTDPAYDFLHNDKRYRAIVGEMGLPPAW